MQPTVHRTISIAAAAALLGTLSCSRTPPADAGPTGTGHAVHLEQGAFAAPLDCATCHAPTGFTVDFSQNPLLRATGATFDATSKTCTVYCHGQFTFGAVSGSGARPVWTDATPLDCGSCHAMPPAGHPPLTGTVTAATCNACHPQTVDPQGHIVVVGAAHMDGKAQTAGGGCTSCHGDATRTPNLPGADVNLKSAPPVAPANAPAYATGAHLGHVNPAAAGALMAPIACAECHPVPGDAAHATQPPPQPVVFGRLATSGGAAPTWVSTTAGCAASYCHGNFTFGAVTGANATPTWTDTAPLGCTSCHGMPPTGHLALPGTVTAVTCNACHPQTVDVQGNIVVAGGTHIDGRAQTTGAGCTSCHGDPTRTPNLPGTDVNLTSAPPVAPANAPAYAVGAHLGHVNPTAAGAVMPPVACSECHPVPGDATHATRPPPQPVLFGPLASSGGATPTWVSTTAGCAASYCHGNFTFGPVTGANATPIWTSTAPIACTSCHAMPPAGHPAYAGAQDAPGCYACHPQSVNSDGTIKAGGGHLNGRADGGDCKTCHGAPPATGRHLEEDHVGRRCDACHPTGYTSTVAVAAFHQNGVVDLGAQAGYSCGLHGCPPGVVGTCTNSCHTQPQRW